MFVAASEIDHLIHLGFRNFIGIDTAHADTAAMHMEHDARRIFAALAEEPLQHMDDELHRRVVVIEQKHLVHRGLLGLRLALDDDAGLAVVLRGLVVVAHLLATDSRGSDPPGACVYNMEFASLVKSPVRRATWF